MAGSTLHEMTSQMILELEALAYFFMILFKNLVLEG